MKKLTLAFLACCVAGASLAQNLRTKENRILPVYQSFKNNAELPTRESFFSYLHKQYNLGNEVTFKIKNSLKDELGMVHERYQQYVNGYPVEGGEIILHTRNNTVESYNGDVFPITNSAPVINEQIAFGKALDYFKADLYAWQVKSFTKKAHNAPTGQLIWAPEKGNARSGKFVLAYKYDLYALKPLKKAFVFIDATDGHLLWEKNALMENQATGTAYTKYSGTRQLITESVSSTEYNLEDNSRGQGIGTYNMQNTQSNYAQFQSANNIWLDTVGIHGAEYDVHWGFQRVYDFYDTVFHRQSYDGMGSEIVGFVHFDVNYTNAFWDGQEMMFGDGDLSQNMRPFTALEIIGHELTHGVTEHSAGLDYADEPGALNESFSDIMGKTIEKRYKPTTFSWLIGKEIFTNGSAMRSMSNPKSAGDPDCYLGLNYYIGIDDNGGVHTNSGVQNHWFYILSNGKSGTNDLGNSYAVTGIGMNKAAAIAYRNLTVYLNQYSTYSDASFYAIQAATDLYGACSNEVVQTTNAWYAVGLGTQYPTANLVHAVATLPATAMVGKYVYLNSTSTNATSLKWYADAALVGTHVSDSCKFTSIGAHNVILVAANSYCTDTVKKAITIQVNVGVNGVSGGDLFNVYPNPASGSFVLAGNCSNGSKISYVLTDITGKAVAEKQMTVSATNYKETVPVQQLASGVYSLTVTNNEQKGTTQIVIKN